MTDWVYLDKSVSSISDAPKGAFGFVYLITNLDKNKIYIGKKQFYSVRKKNFTKKQLEAITDNRLKKHTFVTTEASWKSYTGSNRELNEDIKKGDKITREIICYAKNKAELTYYETKHQFGYGVLERDSFNDNILGKFYRKLFKQID